MAAAPIIGGIISAAGAMQQGNDTASALNRQAELQRRNAAGAIAAAKQNAYRQGLSSAKMLGGADAGYAAAGVSHDSGSVLDVIAASASNAELDRQNILYGGEIRAVNFQNQAAIDEASGVNAQRAAGFNAFAGLFGGAVKTYANYSGGGGGGGSGGATGDYAGPDQPAGGQA